ncbi:hypothetical protein [Bacillus phage SBSphiJ3]|nr:hypothetical protein [Bacillus phage SBSphiJ3]
MAHYDYLYEDVTVDTIEENIFNAKRRIDMYKERVSEVEADLNRYVLLNKTSRDILQNAKEQDELAIRVVRTSVEKMSKLLERVRNGESVTYQEFISAR